MGNEQEAIAYYRKAFEILDSALETARDNLKLLGATLERQPFDRQNAGVDLDSMRLHQLVDLRVDVQAPRNC